MKKISLLLVIILIASCLGCALPGIAFAASETIYTGVIEDLSKDETFNAAQFPAGSEDKMDLIQVAESNAGELFLYVYSPTGDKFTASEVRISQTIGDNVDPKDYTLTMLSREGTLAKYKVNGLQVKADAVRYYLVIQIARPYNKEIDSNNVSSGTITGATVNGNLVNTVVYSVEKQFTACTIDEQVTYTEKHADVIPIEDKHVGYIEYLNGFKWFTEYCNSCYVAFNTNIDIDKLFEADVTFVPVSYKKWRNIAGKETFEYKSPGEETKVKLTNEDSAKNSVGLWGTQYEWTRIERVTDFLNNEKLTEDAKKNLSDKQWVLRFYESDRKELTQFGTGQIVITGTMVENVTVLRLKFETNGTVYNLGVVDNKQSVGPEQKPDNYDDFIDRWERFMQQCQSALKKVGDFFIWLGEHWWVIIVGLVVIGLIVSLIVFIVRKGAAVVFKVIGKVLLFILKWIIFLPITLIVYGIRAAKKNKQ